MVLQRMGLENCEGNMWALQLKSVVSTKLQTPIAHFDDPLALEETLRCDEFSRNNHKLFKYIKGLKAIQGRRNRGGSVIFTNVEYVIQEVEKLHINRVKEIMISALN